MAPNRNQDEKNLARQGRLVALVIAATMLLWMAAQWVGKTTGLEARYVFLFDLLALAGFAWALVVGLQLWRKQRDGEP